MCIGNLVIFMSKNEKGRLSIEPNVFHRVNPKEHHLTHMKLRITERQGKIVFMFSRVIDFSIFLLKVENIEICAIVYDDIIKNVS